VLLTQRASQLKNHAGPDQFPRWQDRPEECRAERGGLARSPEEIGLEARFVSVCGVSRRSHSVERLPGDTGSRLRAPGLRLALDEQEVSDTFEVPLSYVFEPRTSGRSGATSAARRRDPRVGHSIPGTQHLGSYCGNVAQSVPPVRGG